MPELKVLLKNIDVANQKSLAVYEQSGGYATLRKVRSELTPDQVIEQVKEAGLRGRGGAGFPTGMKWSFVPKDPNLPKYLVCNCDESEPGTFKDRVIIEKDPHQLIEGIAIASYAIGAKKAFIYSRGEFFEGIATLQTAVDEAKAKGHLGELDIVVHTGAGAYIAGEETAQLDSLEGGKAQPRSKPPFPAIAGLYGKPTVINNVETLCNAVHIVKNGPKWFQSIGKERNNGTKIFQVSGHVRKPGVVELPLGTPLREVIFEHAGGMREGRKFKAVYPGGSSCALLTEKDLDVPMDFDSLAALKTMLGTASLIVMDDSADMVKVAHRLMEFYQNESCGKCTPCREGTRWMVQVLNRILGGGGTQSDLDLILNVCDNMAANSFCPLAVGAAPPVISAIVNFRGEFESYIKKNPNWNKPREMAVKAYL